MTIALPTPAAAHRPRPMPAWKIHLYRQCRTWHGWLSAFAFIALMFFSATGILLNHPEWFVSEDAAPVESHAHLEPQEVKGRTPSELGALLTTRKLVHGVYASGDIDDGLALLRFEGVSGNSSVTLDLHTGAADIAWRKTTALTALDDLHRGKNAGAVWKWLIDVSGGLFLVLSLVGYILFFSMRHKLRTVALLTLGSIGILAAVFYAFVP